MTDYILIAYMMVSSIAHLLTGLYMLNQNKIDKTFNSRLNNHFEYLSTIDRQVRRLSLKFKS